MSYGSLIESLAITGSRKSDGTPNASGRVWIYEVGTTTPATAYSDADASAQLTQPVTLDAAGKVPSATGGPYVTEPVRIVVEYLVSTGTYATLSDYTYLPADAAAVTVRNDGFTGLDSDGSTTAGGDTDLDAVLSSIYASTGGTDAKYLESAGATARTIKAKFAELSVSVKDFGAKGDGIAIDTTAIQAAINRVAALGGGEVYFGPGVFRVDQPLTNTTAGVSLHGAGRAATTVKGTSSTANLFVLSGSTGSFSIRDMSLSNTGTSTGTAIALSGAVGNVSLENVKVDGYKTSLSLSGVIGVVIKSSGFSAIDGDAAARALSCTDSTSVTVLGSTFYGGSTGQSMEFLGASGSVSVTGSVFSTSYVKFNTNLTGTGFRFIGNSFDNGTNDAFVFGGATMPKGFMQSANGVDGYKGGLLTGATFTPDLGRGSTIIIDATTTGSAYTVAVPSPPPAATDYGVYMTLIFYCHAGGAITGWGAAAGYHTSSGPSTTDTQRTAYRFWWDPDNSVWREMSRSVTT